MRRYALVIVAAITMVSPLAGQSPQFDVASIKRDTSERALLGRLAGQPAGQITEGFVARFMATRAYPDLTPPLEVTGLPAWADSERYVVSVRFKPDATPQEQTEMWRQLFIERLKLQAHYETRDRPGFRLVVARSDGKLGPNIKPAADCRPLAQDDPAMLAARDALRAAVVGRRPPTPQEEHALLGACHTTMFAGDTAYVGSITLENFGRLIQSATARTVIDGTGLPGFYTIKFTFLRRPTPTPDPDGPPSVFTALPEQLGLQLESTTIPAKILVVDHIERPTEN